MPGLDLHPTDHEARLDTSATLTSFLEAILADVDELRKLLEKDGRQVVRRSYVRAIFAAIDGLCFQLKQDCLERAQKNPTLYLAEEIGMLREQKYLLTSSGKTTARPFYPAMEDNIKFSMLIYFRGMSDIKLSFETPEWIIVRQALKKRHQITHPKLASELDISDADLQVATKAFVWLTAMFTLNAAKSIRRMIPILESMASRLRKEIGRKNRRRSA